MCSAPVLIISALLAAVACCLPASAQDPSHGSCSSDDAQVNRIQDMIVEKMKAKRSVAANPGEAEPGLVLVSARPLQNLRIVCVRTRAHAGSHAPYDIPYTLNP
jgi:hypothetical protein